MLFKKISAPHLITIRATKLVRPYRMVYREYLSNKALIITAGGLEDAARLRGYVSDLHDTQNRDIVVVNRDKVILADAIQKNIGTTFDHDTSNQVGSTIQDGVSRIFIEQSVDYPAGIKQITLPLKSSNNAIVGAVVLEYTPLYNALAEISNDSITLISIISVGCMLLAIGLGYGIARTITIPMKNIVRVAELMADGDFDQSISVTSGGELGALQRAFHTMATSLIKTIRQQTEHLQEQITTATTARMAAEAARAETAVQLATIETQQAVITEMSTPILPLTPTTLVMPLVGALDAVRLQMFQERTLQAIEQTSARYLILDITGVPVVDTSVASRLIEVVQAVRLLGSEVIVVGIRPEVAQTIVGLGIHLQDIVTRSTLQSGIAYTQYAQTNLER